MRRVDSPLADPVNGDSNCSDTVTAKTEEEKAARRKRTRTREPTDEAQQKAQKPLGRAKRKSRRSRNPEDAQKIEEDAAKGRRRRRSRKKKEADATENRTRDEQANEEEAAIRQRDRAGRQRRGHGRRTTPPPTTHRQMTQWRRRRVERRRRGRSGARGADERQGRRDRVLQADEPRDGDRSTTRRRRAPLLCRTGYTLQWNEEVSVVLPLREVSKLSQRHPDSFRRKRQGRRRIVANEHRLADRLEGGARRARAGGSRLWSARLYAL